MNFKDFRFNQHLEQGPTQLHSWNPTHTNTDTFTDCKRVVTSKLTRPDHVLHLSFFQWLMFQIYCIQSNIGHWVQLELKFRMHKCLTNKQNANTKKFPIDVVEAHATATDFLWGIWAIHVAKKEVNSRTFRPRRSSSATKQVQVCITHVWSEQRVVL